MPKLYATVKRVDSDRLSIETRYVLEPGERSDFRGLGSRGIKRPESIHKISFEEWEKYIGQTIPFSELKGSGEGMIGGATRTRVGKNSAEDDSELYWVYEGILSQSPLYVATILGKKAEIEEEVKNEVADLAALLEDESYEFSEDIREKMMGYINAGRKFLAED